MDKTYFKNTFHFSSDSSTPLYLQLASYIRIQIQAILPPKSLLRLPLTGTAPV